MNTTKKLLGLAFALLISTFSIAQVSLGVKGGINFANISTPDLSVIGIPKTQTNPSITVGAIAEIPIAGGFSIQPELNFTQKGFVIKENIPLDLINMPLPIGVKATTDLNYFELPVLAKMNFGNEKTGAYVTAGPTVSYAQSARFRTSTNFIIDINIVDQKFDLDALNISRWDIGASVGAGGTVNLGGTKLFVDARYTHGFQKLDNIPVIDLDFKNKSFALTTGFLIPLGSGKVTPRA